MWRGSCCHAEAPSSSGHLFKSYPSSSGPLESSASLEPRYLIDVQATRRTSSLTRPPVEVANATKEFKSGFTAQAARTRSTLVEAFCVRGSSFHSSYKGSLHSVASFSTLFGMSGIAISASTSAVVPVGSGAYQRSTDQGSNPKTEENKPICGWKETTSKNRVGALQISLARSTRTSHACPYARVPAPCPRDDPVPDRRRAH